jgi:hypothetical protein
MIGQWTPTIGIATFETAFVSDFVIFEGLSAYNGRLCNECKNAVFLGKSNWYAFCRKLESKVDREACWAHTDGTKPEKSNFCQDKFCNKF